MCLSFCFCACLCAGSLGISIDLFLGFSPALMDSWTPCKPCEASLLLRGYRCSISRPSMQIIDRALALRRDLSRVRLVHPFTPASNSRSPLLPSHYLSPLTSVSDLLCLKACRFFSVLAVEFLSSPKRNRPDNNQQIQENQRHAHERSRGIYQIYELRFGGGLVGDRGGAESVRLGGGGGAPTDCGGCGEQKWLG